MFFRNRSRIPNVCLFVPALLRENAVVSATAIRRRVRVHLHITAYTTETRVFICWSSRKFYRIRRLYRSAHYTRPINTDAGPKDSVIRVFRLYPDMTIIDPGRFIVHCIFKQSI